MILLRAVFVVQLVLMLPAFAYLLLTPVHLGTLAVSLYLVPTGLAAVLFALWQFARHPARRRLAAATAATPFLCLAAPMGIYSLNDGPVAPAVLIMAVIALLVVAAVVMMSKTEQWRGTGLFANRQFNLAIVVALGVLLLLLWFPIIAWLASDRSYALPSNMLDRDQVLKAGALYLIAIAVPGTCLALFALLYAPIGLVRNPGGRLAHLGQLVLTLMLLISLIGVAVAAFVGMLNPG